MQVEAISVGKTPADPEANEDRFVVLPGRAYAVIDGVTDRGGSRYGGKSSGRLGAELVQAAVERCLAASPDLPAQDLLTLLSTEIAAGYERHGVLEKARAHPNFRFATTLALFRHCGDSDEILLVGDSGVRLDGEQILQVNKTLDAITATLRVAAWRALERRTSDIATLTRLARQIVFHGAGQDGAQLEGLITLDELAAVSAQTVANCIARFPDVPPATIAELVQGGIVNGQSGHQNNDASPLGYSCLDGFAIPLRHVVVERRPAGTTRRVELFTDGYFAPADDFGVAAWEAAAEEVERVDPLKLGPYPSVKGSSGEIRTDDRTYVGVVL